ncbi:50S ribosomal protein L4 [Candidatus Woesearchaeota archaeon]|nr:50S ribosomal protein L4 [Candidatus Woesearchaeota archaeon]
MKLPLLSIKKEKLGEIELPSQFEEPVREDLIHKAVLMIQSNQRQPYGASPMAGNKYSSFLTKRRRAYRGTYGYGISRTPRKILSRRGRRMFWMGATAPQTVGGRRAHPPKVEKDWTKQMPTKERRKAIRSAIAATLSTEWVLKRGHTLPKDYPFVLEDGICEIEKTKGLVDVLEGLDLKPELEKSKPKKVRAGKGKMRGRKYKTRRGLLIVVPDKCKLFKAAENLPGVEVHEVRNLNVEVLAPGAQPGRLTIWTKGAIEQLEKEKLFV